MSRASLLSLALASAIAGCDMSGPQSFRDPDAPLGASSRFDAAAFGGTWEIFSVFGPARPEQVTIEPLPEEDRFRISGVGLEKIAGRYRQGVPGEMIPEDATRSVLLVMWVDADFETAAIGTADGRFGAIIDRDGQVLPDRAAAARDVLAFYGWNVEALNEVGS